MRITVKAKPGSKENKVIPPALKLLPDINEFYVVYVKERPVGGRANEAIATALAGHFKVPASRIRLVSGNSSRKKVFEIS